MYSKTLAEPAFTSNLDSPCTRDLSLLRVFMPIYQSNLILPFFWLTVKLLNTVVIWTNFVCLLSSSS